MGQHLASFLVCDICGWMDATVCSPALASTSSAGSRECTLQKTAAVTAAASVMADCGKPMPLLQVDYHRLRRDRAFRWSC